MKGLEMEANSGFLNRQATEEPFQEVPRCRQGQGPQEEQELNLMPDGLVMAGRKEKEAKGLVREGLLGVLVVSSRIAVTSSNK